MRVIKLFLILGIIISFLNMKNVALAEELNKTIIIVLDQLDFREAERVASVNSSIGLMSAKTSGISANKSQESLFLTIATGRRVKIEDSLFSSIDKLRDGSLSVKGYKSIIKDLDSRYPGFSQEIKIMGQHLKDNDIKISYIGNSSSAIIASDIDGRIAYGENFVNYDLKWLINKTEDLLNYTDILVISYNTSGEETKLNLLDEYIKAFETNDIIVFPRRISGDMKIKFNSTLVPIIYNTNGEAGLVTSDSTHRDSIVTNLDIFPTIADKYGIDINTDVGSKINIVPHSNSLEKTRDNFNGYLNFNVIKYIFHGLMIILQLYVLLSFFRKKELNTNRSIFFMNLIITGILVSFVLGFFNLHQSILLYSLILILLTLIFSLYLGKRVRNFIGLISLITNLIMLIGIFAYPKLIYDSYIGYNNIIAGGRFYGLNNEAMGVLLVTAIVGYFYMYNKISSHFLRNIILIVYMPLNVLALSSRFGANFGGYLTSIALLLMMMYSVILKKRINKGSIIVLLTIGIIVFLSNFYIDLNSVSSSHGGGLISRIGILGYSELIGMISTKVKQLLFMIIVPPWSIMFLFQLYFIRSFYVGEKVKIQRIKREQPEILKKGFIIFMTSIVALLINDTGVIAFVYMNTYLVSTILSLHNIK